MCNTLGCGLVTQDFHALPRFALNESLLNGKQDPSKQSSLRQAIIKVDYNIVSMIRVSPHGPWMVLPCAGD